MGIEGFLATQKSRNTQDIAYEPATVISTQSKAPGVSRNYKMTYRRQLNLRQCKDFALKLNAFSQFLQRRTLANNYRPFTQKSTPSYDLQKLSPFYPDAVKFASARAEPGEKFCTGIVLYLLSFKLARPPHPNPRLFILHDRTERSRKSRHS